MRVVHTVDSLHPEHGGPSRSIPSLCHALQRDGLDVTLLSRREGGFAGIPGDAKPDDSSVESGLSAADSSARRRTRGVRAFERALAATVERGGGGVVHDHGLWLPSNHVVAQVAGRYDLPRVVSVRGMLSAWARRQNRYRKAIAWRLYQRSDLVGADAVHVTSAEEAAAVRDAGVGSPVAIIPNGVELPSRPARMSSDGKFTALFLARMHPGKGARELIEAWSRLRPAGWRLVLAGPDVGGQRGALDDAVRSSGLDDTVSLPGELSDVEKWSVLEQADLFVLPTRSENFGLSIAEALAAGLPVITTHGAPWSDLESHQCGWWIPHGVDALTSALSEALSLPVDVRREMGMRGRGLVSAKYSWTSVALRMAQLYSWVLAKRRTGHAPPQPEFLEAAPRQ